MQSRSVAPRSASEMRMAAAVAESTTAAAEAAKAAAQVGGSALEKWQATYERRLGGDKLQNCCCGHSGLDKPLNMKEGGPCEKLTSDVHANMPCLPMQRSTASKRGALSLGASRGWSSPGERFCPGLRLACPSLCACGGRGGFKLHA